MSENKLEIKGIIFPKNLLKYVKNFYKSNLEYNIKNIKKYKEDFYEAKIIKKDKDNDK